MKNSLACPKCQSRKLWRIENVRHESDISKGRELPVAMTLYYGVLGTTGQAHGKYDAYVCSQCGYTEFWAHSFDKLVPDPESGIHLIDTTTHQSAYQ